MLSESWNGIQRLLLIRGDSSNPLSHLLPVIDRLRTTLPDTHLTLLSPQISYLPENDIEYLPLRTLDRTLIEQLQSHAFDGAIVFTAPGQSPYAMAYVCYLAGIPIRIGQSQEFGGSVLSHWIKPQPQSHSLTDHYFHLLDLPSK